MKIDSVIFDVDGVLLDSVPYHFKAWKKLFEEEGRKFTFDDYLNKVNGIPRMAGIKNILPDKTDEELKSLSDLKQSYLLEMIEAKFPEPLSGVESLLRKLINKKYKLAAASSSKNSPALLEKSGLKPLFKVIVSGYDFKHAKPHPDIFLTAISKLGSKPEASVVVEDATVGIRAAINAGAKTIGVLTSNDEKIASLADLTIKSLGEHEKIFNFLSS